MNEAKHRILKGDWIIRNPDPPPSSFLQEQAMAKYIESMMGLAFLDYSSYADHAIHVLDATQSHLTVFDPLHGRSSILCYDRYPGVWSYATEEQVRTTWELAMMLRGSQSMQIKMEMERFKYVRQVAR